MTMKKINNKYVFFKETLASLKNSDVLFVPAVWVEKNIVNGAYSVYRSSISWSRYNKKLELGNGWNLFTGLTKKQAFAAAKSALKYLK